MGLIERLLLVTAGVMRLSGIVFVGIAFFGYSHVHASTAAYEAVIDAGSSGTRLYLYEYRNEPQGPVMSLLLEDEPDKLRGLSTYADKPAQAGQGEIGPLLDGLETFVKTKGIDPKAVSVSVLATAGMRLVEPGAAQRIYDSVRQEIGRRGLVAREVGTITGQSEGIYAWVDVNYLKGNLRLGQTTDGIVEIGGASAQVALAVSSPNRHSGFVRRVQIGEQSYDVLSVSYLGLGQNEARRAMLEQIAADALASNPCYPNSQSDSVVFEAAKGRKGVAALTVAGNKSSFTPACFDVYANVVQSTAARAINRFPVAQFQSVPGFERSRFVLMASFYHKLRDWDLIAEKRLDRSLLAELFSRCVGTDAWVTVSGQQGTGFFAQNACANATYLYTFIFSGRGLALSHSRVQVLDEVNGESLTWTRGYALLAAGSSK
ncbi:MAG: hypothetical protein LRY53_00650 [Burkholderiaceae bacterium]|nr:hypothetical protein [Burkholderiaceae bacterium]